MEISVRLDEAKVAMSEGSLGTVGGVQFAAVFQSPLVGLRLHVALPPKVGHSRRKSVAIMAAQSLFRLTSAALLFLGMDLWRSITPRRECEIVVAAGRKKPADRGTAELQTHIESPQENKFRSLRQAVKRAETKCFCSRINRANTHPQRRSLFFWNCLSPMCDVLLIHVNALLHASIPESHFHTSIKYCSRESSVPRHKRSEPALFASLRSRLINSSITAIRIRTRSPG